MSTFRRFEDIKAWQLARELNREIYRATQAGEFSRDFALRDQIRRASISVSSNIAEGHERRSPRDFARFLTIAKASAAEVRSQLYLALDLGYLSDDEATPLFDLTLQIGRTLSGLIRYLLRDASEAVGEPYEAYSSLEDNDDLTPLGTLNSEL